MKKVILLGLICIATLASAQESKEDDKETKETEKTKTTGYVSVGLSVSNNSDFNAGSYTAIEAGLQRKNVALGAIFGRGNLSGMGWPSDNIKNYYYEIKTTGYFPLGELNGSIILGWGSYINSVHTLIEYGVGISYSKGKMGYGVTYSNWDGVNYLTPAVTFNF